MINLLGRIYLLKKIIVEQFVYKNIFNNKDLLLFFWINDSYFVWFKLYFYLLLIIFFNAIFHLLLRVWDTANGMEIKILSSHSDCIRAVVFCSDGKCLASGSDDNTIRFRNSSKIFKKINEPLINNLRVLNSHLKQILSENTIRLII